MQQNKWDFLAETATEKRYDYYTICL